MQYTRELGVTEVTKDAGGQEYEVLVFNLLLVATRSWTLTPSTLDEAKEKVIRDFLS